MQHLNQQYLTGDFFICASERQRNWWLGLLEANGRINPWVFAEDRSLRRLMDVVPYGLPETAPVHTHQVVKEVWPGIKAQDRVILWGGGLWPWLDPLTAIRAMAEVTRQRSDVRLIFPGTRHPNPWMEGVPTHNEQAFHLAQDLDLLDRVVFFGDWVPYADWPNVLLESDLALTLHYDTLETQLAFRSRVLDYIWAGLPIVAAKGDATSDLIAHYGLGTVVDYEDVNGVAEAILKLLEVPMGNFEERFERARQALSWKQAVRPLIEFCRSPRRAPDRVALGGQIGSPFYVEEQARLIQERDTWRDVAKRYEQGRFMRFMRWMQSAKKRFGFR
jgi:glycosyltransferase involved in cell wall biosynthesis